MSTRTVTYDLTLITGSAAASKAVVFDLLTPYAARATDAVVQLSTTSTSDENGAGTVTLAVPSSGAYLYSCTLPDGQSFRFSLAAGDATTLHALMAATVGSTVTAADAITAAVDAAITTHNADTTAVHGIADTSDIEPALGNPDADGYVLSSTALGVRSWIQSAADVDDLTTTTGTSTNMLRVAAAGGLEYRTTAQVLADIGAAPTASPTFTGTVTLPTTVASVIKPASDSTTALQLANAAGTAVLTVDTTNSVVDFTGNLGLDKTTSSTTGVITQGGVAFIHNFSHPTGNTAVPVGSNSFVGGAGNFTMGSTATNTIHASYNTALGHASLNANTTGYQNTALGYVSLSANTTGYQNTALGVYALQSNTIGNQNTALGYQAGRYIDGGGANQTSSNSVYLGYGTRASANGNTNEIVIGASAIGAGSNSVTLGNTSITKTVLRGITEFSGTMGNSTKTVGTDAPIDWVQITIGGVAGYIPVYAA